MKIKRAATIAVAMTAAVCATAIAAGTGAAAHPNPVQRPATLAQTIPGGESFAVEDYIHPEADRLGAEAGIKLKDGNGKMIYTDCAAGGSLIRVESTDAKNNVVCFQATSSPAWLNMEITGSFGVKAGQKPVDVTSTRNGTQEKMTVPGNTVRAVGIADGESVVVQLKVN
ncbi:hypothetical protein [Specibacter cremeus]|uniref:hypothetical protein n=1 Tax=Specibacter cremeus TaxID=1629051 RepID=UPI000F769E7F|nr:hypothetical protein [Specibacter cremeus]